MGRIEEALQTNPFRVVPSTCYEAAIVIRSYSRPLTTHAWSNLSENDQLTFKIAFIAICHQFNWDFLQNRLAETLLSEPSLLVDRITNISGSQLQNWLNDYLRPERIRARERAGLLRDVGRTLTERWGGRADNILQEARRRCAGDNGFLQALDHFEAFRADPLRKKSHVLVHDLIREAIVSFADEDAVEPAVDYHLIRIYLRSGRVVPTSRAVLPFLDERPRPRHRLVKLLRETVSEAVKLTALYAKLPIPDVNFIEWQLGRAICRKDVPKCDEAPREELPEDVRTLVGAECPFRAFCEARNHDAYGFFREPRFEKTFY